MCLVMQSKKDASPAARLSPPFAQSKRCFLIPPYIFPCTEGFSVKEYLVMRIEHAND